MRYSIFNVFITLNSLRKYGFYFEICYEDGILELTLHLVCSITLNEILLRR